MSNTEQWYMAIGGHQIGPVNADEIVTNIRNGSLQPDTMVFTSGMTNWTPVKNVAAFASEFSKGSGPVVIPQVPGRTAHEIDFRIFGEDLQFVEVELDPGGVRSPKPARRVACGGSR
jgi:hypothetical protein